MPKQLTPSWPGSLLHWLALPVLLLALTLVFASQLYWSGYVTSWSRAFAREAIYWAAWWPLTPTVFWMCRQLYSGTHRWQRYACGVLVGAVLACLLHPAIVQAIDWLRLGWSRDTQPAWSPSLPLTMLRLAGINLPVYIVLVLGWHAATYYDALRERRLQALEMESLLREAQLQALRSQLNPHFLFNALHSLAELVHENPQLADRLIVRLGDLLRQAMQSATLPDVPLAEEVGFAKCYVEIEQLRLGERLRVQWQLEPQVLQWRVPSLILQPLIENAIQHGIAPSGHAGELIIRAQREAECLHLQVRDSGPGLIHATQRTGIGLSNTRLRLQKLYGERHRFELSSEGGLIVNLYIPASAAVTFAR